ncbi:MAG: hypothetical protein ACLTDC_09340, partial [Lachnospiraceae bacterium]
VTSSSVYVLLRLMEARGIRTFAIVSMSSTDGVFVFQMQENMDVSGISAKGSKIQRSYKQAIAIISELYYNNEKSKPTMKDCRVSTENWKRSCENR